MLACVPASWFGSSLMGELCIRPAMSDSICPKTNEADRQSTAHDMASRGAKVLLK